MQPDLFDFAKEQKAESVLAAAWEEPDTTLWARAWLDNVTRVCLPRYASELAFGAKLLAAGRMQALRVRHGHVQAAFTNREGGTALVNLSVRPLTPERWLALDRLCERCGDALFTSDDLPDETVDALFGQPDGLLPELKDLTFSCSHCRTPFCLYRAATLLAVATEFDRKPIKLFELRGSGRERLFMRSAQMTPDGSAEQIADDDLASLFGIDLA